MREGIPVATEVERLLPGAELAVPAAVLAELDGLAARGVPGAEVARTLARRWRTVPTSARGDAAVLEAAVRLGAGVLTADRQLAERLRRSGIPVLVPRDRTRLELRPGVAGRSERRRRPSGRRPKG